MKWWQSSTTDKTNIAIPDQPLSFTPALQHVPPVPFFFFFSHTKQFLLNLFLFLSRTLGNNIAVFFSQRLCMTSDHLKQELYSFLSLVTCRKLRKSYSEKFGKPFYLFCEAFFMHLYIDHMHLSVPALDYSYFWLFTLHMLILKPLRIGTVFNSSLNSHIFEFLAQFSVYMVGWIWSQALCCISASIVSPTCYFTVLAFF